MLRTRQAFGVALAAASLATPAAAEVLDAVYRGTLVCGDLPFASGMQREAIEVTIAGGTVRYRHVVRLSTATAEATAEQGSGTLSGHKLELKGSWKGAGREYQASYSGTFVRRSAVLKGTQTWAEGGKTRIAGAGLRSVWSQPRMEWDQGGCPPDDVVQAILTAMG